MPSSSQQQDQKFDYPRVVGGYDTEKKSLSLPGMLKSSSEGLLHGQHYSYSHSSTPPPGMLTKTGGKVSIKSNEQAIVLEMIASYSPDPKKLLYILLYLEFITAPIKVPAIQYNVHVHVVLSALS